MDIKVLVGLVVQLSLLLLVAAVGMRSRWEDLLYAVRKPKAFLRAMIAVNVIVPLTACFLAALFPINWMTKGGLIIMAVSPLAPFATGKMMKASADRSFDVGMYAALVLAAVIVVPLTVALLNPFYAHHATISIGAIAWFVIKSVFVPLAVGIGIATMWPNFAQRAAPIATIIVDIALFPVAILFLIKSGSQMQGLIGDGTMVVIVGTILAGLAAGHFLGGRDPGHQAALAQAAATRHPGIAGLIAAHGEAGARQHTMLAVLLFLVVSVILTTLYAFWARRGLASGGSATEGNSS